MSTRGGLRVFDGENEGLSVLGRLEQSFAAEPLLRDGAPTVEAHARLLLALCTGGHPCAGKRTSGRGWRISVKEQGLGLAQWGAS